MSRTGQTDASSVGLSASDSSRSGSSPSDSSPSNSLLSDVTLPDVMMRDVTLRDGLQDESPIPTEHKLVIFEALAASGVQELELTSFVRPDRVPAMADAEALCVATADSDIIRWGLVLNTRGALRAVDAGLSNVQFVVSVSDSHSRDNAGRSTDAALETLAEVCSLVGDSAEVELTLATVFGCPVERHVDPERVIDVAVRAQAAGARSIRLADTIGTAIPSDIRTVVSGVQNEVSVPLGIHLHDTRGLGVANVLTAFDSGIRSFDAAVGGLGGCPFAKGASGNVALEDLVHVFEESGTATGISVTALIDTAEIACSLVGRPVSSHVGIAGPRFQGTGAD